MCNLKIENINFPTNSYKSNQFIKVMYLISMENDTNIESYIV